MNELQLAIESEDVWKATPEQLAAFGLEGG